MKKNIIAIMMAIVALFATQCKKQTEPMTNQPAGETMKVTVRVENNTAKTEITATGAVTWKEGDKLYVVGSEQGLLGYVSALTNGKSVNFEGTIIPVNEVQTLNFYYVGDKKFTLDGDGNYTFDLSAQDGTLAGIAAHNQLMFGTTSDVEVGTTNFGTIQMTSLMAIAHLKITGNNNKNYVNVKGGFAKSTFNAMTYGDTKAITETAGTITMSTATLMGDACNCYLALLPGNQTLSITNVAHNGSLGQKKVEANKFYNSGTPITVAMTFTDLLPGLFTVNKGEDGVYGGGDDKQVQFSPGNLCYADGTFQFEEQWSTECYTLDASGDVTWNPNHVSRFFFSPDADAARGEDLNSSVKTYLFTNDGKTNTANPNFTVEGITGQYRSLSKDEWSVLVGRKNSDNKYLQGTTTLTLEDGTTTVMGMVFLPDGSDKLPTNIKTPADVLENNAVFIPSGRRVGTSHISSTYPPEIGTQAYCWAAWSSSNCYAVHNASTGFSSYNNWNGFPVRLVKDVQDN